MLLIFDIKHFLNIVKMLFEVMAASYSRDFFYLRDKNIPSPKK